MHDDEYYISSEWIETSPRLYTGVFSSFRDSANKISASVFTTSVGAAEKPNGTTGLNRHTTTPKAATQRYSRRQAAWNMTTIAAAGIRISKPTWYPTA